MHAASQIQEISEEGAVNRKGLEQRFQEVRALVEDEFRRDLDRNKSMLQSLMADQRIAKAKLEEDSVALERRVNSLEANSQAVEGLKRSIEVLEIRSHEV